VPSKQGNSMGTFFCCRSDTGIMLRITDVSPERFVKAVLEHKPQIVGMSALLTTTMPGMGNTIKALTEAGLRDQVKVMIGGAPVTDGFAKQVGADGYSPDASSAVRLAKGLIG
ncbi:MAG: cobalamin-dependent protein, partial [Anaerolineae bacterium]|nr:cobalamin-dependent protein [Anaerolineae bacterium]